MVEGAEPTAGSALAGRYVLEERIGTGGAGLVWRAHDRVLDRQVAVKLLHAALADDGASAARFRTEAASAARLTHPNAVVVFDIGRDGDRDYLVMELVDGADLAEVLAAGRLRPGVVAHLGRAVASALGAAHARRLVHRDVKPGNILLSREGVPKVADFGIARAIGAAMTRLTQPGNVMGTARYVAPEQLRDDHVDARADVYALGLLLHEALTGRPPWGEGTATEVAMRRLANDHPPPSAARDDLPPGLDAVVARATRLDADERYDDGTEFAAALSPFVDPEAGRTLAGVVSALPRRPPAPSPGGPADGQRRTTPPAPAGPRRDAAGAATTSRPTQPPPPGRPSTRTSSEAATRALVGRSDAHEKGRSDVHEKGRSGAPEDGRPGAGGDGRTAPPPGRAADDASGTADLPAAGGAQPRRRAVWMVAAVAILAATVVGILGMLDDDRSTAGDGGTADGDTAPDATGRIEVVDVGDHDPLGDDGEERPELLGEAIDGDPDTAWQTHTYRQADLIPPDKDGVGIWFDLGESVEVARIDLDLLTDGASFEVWSGDDAPDPSNRPEDWGTRHAEVDDASAQQQVDLEAGATGRYWLVWFTRLSPADGDGFRAHVADAEFRAG